jgi:hypothetical protein
MNMLVLSLLGLNLGSEHRGLDINEDFVPKSQKGLPINNN